MKKSKNNDLILVIVLLIILICVIGMIVKKVIDYHPNDNEIIQTQENKKICLVNDPMNKGKYQIGTVYNCDPGDGIIRTFYIIENNESTITLIMDSNLGNMIPWASSEDITEHKKTNSESEPVTAKNYLLEQTKNWKVDVDLPTYNQIDKIIDENSGIPPEWLSVNLDDNGEDEIYGPYGYWTSAALNSTYYMGWFVNQHGYLELDDIGALNDNTCGVRPVITISKINIE